MVGFIKKIISILHPKINNQKLLIKETKYMRTDSFNIRYTPSSALFMNEKRNFIISKTYTYLEQKIKDFDY